MKKLIPFALVLCLLAGCGGGGETKDAYDTEKTPAALFAAEVFSEELELLDTDIACILYGIDESELADCAVYTSTGATAEEVGVFQFKTEDQAEAALLLLEQRRVEQKLAYASYAPLEIPKLESAIIERSGTTVLYVAAADTAAAHAALGGE